MFSILILLMVAAASGAAVWAFLEWQKTRSMTLLFNMGVLLTALLHCLFAGMGHWVGVGTELRGYYVLPLLLGIVALPFSLFTFAGISRASGFAWAKIDWGHGIVDIVAVALLLWSLPRIMGIEALGPGCWRDVIWYAYEISPSMSCEASPSAAGVPASLFAVSLSVLAAYLGLGAGLWWRQRWPWLLVGMVAGIMLLALPADWGPLPQFAGELVCAVAIVAVAVRHVRLHPPRKKTPVAEDEG